MVVFSQNAALRFKNLAQQWLRVCVSALKIQIEGKMTLQPNGVDMVLAK